MIVRLPFPPAELSGHTKGHWSHNAKLVATYRAEAFHVTKDAKRKAGYTVPASGDIGISFKFVPPDNRGDRLNFANRIKAQADGIAEALGVNDKRFLPSYSYCDPQAPGWIEVELSPVSSPTSALAELNKAG